MAFKTQNLNKQNFIQKIFKQLPKSNALIEINNKLASTDLLNVTVEDIQSIIYKYKIDLKKKLYPELKIMYGKYMKFCLTDKELSDEEIEKLKHIKQLFMLNDTDVKNIQEKAVSEIYKSEVEKVITDGKIDDDEKHFLEQLKNKLRLDDKNAAYIYSLSAQEMLTKTLNNAVSDQRLSPEEDQALLSLADNLGVSLKMEGPTKALLDKYRLYWQIENGNIPVIDAEINLQKGECCHFFTNIDWLEQRKVTQRVNYGGPTMRIKIAKGIYWRAGSMSVQTISKDVWQTIDSGAMYLTNKRLIFMGARGNKNIKLNKILDFTAFSNGVDIQKDTGKSPFLEFTNNVDLFILIMGRLIINES